MTGALPGTLIGSLIGSGRARAAAVTLVVAAAAGALAVGLSGGDDPSARTPAPTSAAGDSPAAAGGAPHAGSYPVATAQPAVTATPTVTPGGYQLVAAGVPVELRTPDAQAVITVSGPDVDVPVPQVGQPITASRAPGVLTVTVTASAGSVPVRAGDFLGLDEQQEPYALTSDAAQATATPGHPVTVHLASDFASGHTTLTWQPGGAPLVTWDFVVEID